MSARDTIIAELGLPSVESIIARVEAVLGGADFYECVEPERLTHEDVSEALWGYLDDVMWHTSPGEGPPEVAVRAYDTAKISDKKYTAEALKAASIVIEDLDAEYGGDGARDEVEAAETALATELEALIRKHYPQSLVWRCIQVGKDCDLTEKECWSLVLDHCCDGELAEWVAAAKAWLASPEVVADAERAERQRRAEEGRESVPEPYGSVVGEWDAPPVHEPEKHGTVKHTTVGGVGRVGRLRRA